MTNDVPFAAALESYTINQGIGSSDSVEVLKSKNNISRIIPMICGLVNYTVSHGQDNRDTMLISEVSRKGHA